MLSRYDLNPVVRPAVPFAGLEDGGIRIRQKVARLGIDEKELFLDTERYRQISDGAGRRHA